MIFAKLVNWATQKRIENFMLYGSYPINIAIYDRELSVSEIRQLNEGQ